MQDLDSASDDRDPREDLFEKETSLRKSSRHRDPTLSRPPGNSRVPRPRTTSDNDLLEGIKDRIRRLYAGGCTVVSGREYFLPGVKAKLEELRMERSVLENKLGPTRIPAGMVLEIRLHGMSYELAPYLAWWGDFETAQLSSLPSPVGPHLQRDRLIWLIWHFRNKAEIRVGRAPNKVRGGYVVCTSCGYQHRLLSRPTNQRGHSYCRRCGAEPRRNIDKKFPTKPLGPITKLMLRRRFKVPRRYLESILAVVPPKWDGGPITLA